MFGKRQFIFILSVIASIVFVIVLAQAVFYSSKNDITIPEADAQQVVHGDYPVRLSIPALHVNAKVQQVGITQSGKMAVPSNYTDVGWYKYGTEPGKTGSAVIAGHVDNGLALPGVFVHLSSLHIGDDIYITMKSGTVAHYVMVGSKSYDKDVSTEEIFNEGTSKLLQLITCTGTWISSLGTHNKRLVVTALLQ